MVNTSTPIRRSLACLALALFIAFSGEVADAQTTAFTYQGKLTDNNTPPMLLSGNFDFQFKLFDAASLGTQLGPTLTFDGTGGNPPFVVVSSGIFTVTLDFGACPTCFNGAARFLEIGVKPHGGGAFTPLVPRQPITSTPYALKTMNLIFTGPFDNGAGTSFTATNTFTGEGAGLNTAPDPLLASPLGKFNSFYGAAAGKANTSGFLNSFFGSAAGSANTTGNSNSFFGRLAGSSNTTGFNNSFFGRSAGSSNTTSFNNSFFGVEAGFNTTTGSSNAFFGAGAGFNNTTGVNNTFIGTSANFNTTNPTGDNNTLLGTFTAINSGVSNGTAIGASASVTQSNSLILGSINGVNGATADTNVGIGTTAPSQRLHVVGDGLFTGNLTVNGTLTASLPTGSPNYIQNGTSQQATSNFNISGNGTAGGTLTGNIVNATTQFNIGGSPALRFQLASANVFVGNTGQGGVENSFFGYQAGLSNQTACCNSFFGRSAGVFNTLGIRNSFFGLGAGFSNSTGSENTAVGDVAGDTVTVGSKNTFLGAFADASANNLSNATAIGAYAQVTQSNSLVLGSINGVNDATADTNVGIGTTAPAYPLHVSGSAGVNAAQAVAEFTNSAPDTGIRLKNTAASGRTFTLFSSGGTSGLGAGTFHIYDATAGQDRLAIDAAGNVFILQLGPGGTTLCHNGAQITNCSSSLRYKTDIQPFTAGLELVRRLRPIRFSWKQGGGRDVGFAAEEVEQVEPLLTTRNDKGEIEGVKYGQLTTVLVNAVKEQQAEIEKQNDTIRRQQTQIEALKRLVCLDHPEAEMCKP